jgi:hypothetical protein
VEQSIFFAMKITINPGIDKTAQKIIELAKSAEAMGESSVLTKIAGGVLVTIHSKKFEPSVDLTRKRFSFAELVENEM